MSDIVGGSTSPALWDAFFRGVPHGMVLFEAVRSDAGRLRDFVWVDVNVTAADILRVKPSDLIGRSLRAAYPDQLDPRLLRRLVSALTRRRPREFEYAIPVPAGRRAVPEGAGAAAVADTDTDADASDGTEGPMPAWWYAVTVVPVDDDRLVVMFRSITGYKDVLRQAIELMNHDDLTGLPNRRHLKSRFWILRKRGTPMALLYFDLNGFKSVNDRYGHESGDRVLGVIGQRLKQNVRPGEMVARIGGDEFAVLIGGADVGTLDRVAERLIQSVEEPIHLSDLSVQLSASVGAALYPDDARSFEALLGQADERMYQHKRARTQAVDRA